jgi:hypothetical protein
MPILPVVEKKNYKALSIFWKPTVEEVYLSKRREEKPQSSDIPHKQMYMSKINNMRMNARFAQCAVCAHGGCVAQSVWYVVGTISKKTTTENRNEL